MQRQFTSGSRQAPDPFDQFLENEGFYRKHTARDSSSLFRTISEQMYDTQLHHLAIRENCVSYMRTNKQFYQNKVNKDIDEYLDELSKPKTYGTLTELHAVAYLYRRNVLLFEAYNTGKWFFHQADFDDVFRIFYTPENHFDSVFTNDFIRSAAFCQAITYEILYKNVFKLPDITYAVEKMLHVTSFDNTDIRKEYNGQYTKRIFLEDGRVFTFDGPEDTCCILDNSQLCHFHNDNFLKFSENLQDKLYSMENSTQYEKHRTTKKSLLHERYVSCVRQLLKEGITPFPYKVAKALDPDMYRNIEFDSWSEMKREQRYKQWYSGGSNLQVGVKCCVKLENSQKNLYTCHIQEMSPENGPCLVYIEELGEKRVVPYDFLRPLPPNEAKAWPMPYRIQKYLNNDKRQAKISEYKKNVRNCNGKGMRNDQFEWSSQYNYSDYKKEMLITNEDDEYSDIKHDYVYKLKPFTSLRNFNPTHCDFITMPLNVNHNGGNGGKNSETNKNNHSNNDNLKTPLADGAKNEVKSDETSDLEFSSVGGGAGENYPYGSTYADSYYTAYPYDNSIIHVGGSHPLISSAPPPYYCMYNSPYPNHGGLYMQSSAMHCVQQTPTNFYPSQFYSIPPGAPNQSVMNTSSCATGTNFSTPPYHRGSSTAQSTIASSIINFAAGKSLMRSGSDLPTDIPTLQYFYNLGIEYYRQIHGSNSDYVSRGNVDNKEMNKIPAEYQPGVKSEDSITCTSQMNKSDSNNNNLTSGTTNSQGQQNHPRRFNSRYFNNRKDNNNKGYRNTQAMANQRFSSDFVKSSKNNKNNLSVKVSSSNAINSTGIVNEQTSQIPLPSSDGEYIQVSSQYNVTYQPPISSYPPHVAAYSAEGDQQLNTNGGGGILVPPPMYSAGLSYSMFGQPPPPGPGQPSAVVPHNGGLHQAYVGPPIPAHNQPVPIPQGTYPSHPSTPYYSQNAETPPAILGSEATAVETTGHYTFMNYPPVFYSPANGNSAPTAPPPSGYWYPPPQPMPMANQGNTPTPINSSLTSNN